MLDKYRKGHYFVTIVMLYFPYADYMYTWYILGDPHSLPLTMHLAENQLLLQSVKVGLPETHVFRQTEIDV